MAEAAHLSGEIDVWIDLGTPDESRLRKACGRAGQVILYCYGDRAVPVWWEKVCGGLQRFTNLQVFSIGDNSMRELGTMSAAGMQLQCTVQDGEAKPSQLAVVGCLLVLWIDQHDVEAVLEIADLGAGASVVASRAAWSATGTAAG